MPALATWAFTGNSFAVTNKDANVAASDLGFTFVDPNGCNVAILSSGFATDPAARCSPDWSATSAATAVTRDSYIYFTIAPAEGYRLNLSSLAFRCSRGGSSTPRGWVLRSSVDAYAANIDAKTIAQAMTTWQNDSVDLSGAGFQGLTSPVTFRLYLYAPGSTYYVYLDDIAVNGAIALIDPYSTSESLDYGGVLGAVADRTIGRSDASINSGSRGGAPKRAVPRDKLTLYVGATAPEIELLHDPSLEITGLQWLTQMPGGDASLSFSIACANPLIRLRNALKTDNKIWLKFGGATIWQGWVLPLETEIGESDGKVNVECAGTYERTKRNEAIRRTWVDRDTTAWQQHSTHNAQVSYDTTGQLLQYLNNGSSIDANNPGCLYYWVNNGGSEWPQVLTKFTFSYDVNVGAASIYADIDSANSPTSLSWANQWRVNNTTGTGTVSLTLSTFVLRFQFYSTSKIDPTATTRYAKLTNISVMTQAAAPTIDSAMWSLVDSAHFCDTQDTETLDTLNHLVYRDNMSIGAMLADIPTRTNRLIDWGIFGTTLYAKERPAATVQKTLALRRADLADGTSDSIVGDFESTVDQIVILYTYGGYVLEARAGTRSISSRTRVFDYSSEEVGATEAGNIAARRLALYNASAYLGSFPVSLSRLLQNDCGAPIDPLSLSVRDYYLRRTYDLSNTPIKITSLAFDLDQDTCTIGVGAAEERQLWLPGSNPITGTRRVKKYGPWRTVRGRRTRKSWWEFQ